MSAESNEEKRVWPPSWTDEDIAFQLEAERLDAALKPKLTPEFMETLLLAIRTVGIAWT